MITVKLDDDKERADNGYLPGGGRDARWFRVWSDTDSDAENGVIARVCLAATAALGASVNTYWIDDPASIGFGIAVDKAMAPCWAEFLDTVIGAVLDNKMCKDLATDAVHVLRSAIDKEKALVARTRAILEAERELAAGDIPVKVALDADLKIDDTLNGGGLGHGDPLDIGDCGNGTPEYAPVECPRCNGFTDPRNHPVTECDRIKAYMEKISARNSV